MGFFTTRKPEDNNEGNAAAASSGPSDNTVVRVIRSRFVSNLHIQNHLKQKCSLRTWPCCSLAVSPPLYQYGKQKGKERETPNISFSSNDASAAETLSGPSSRTYGSKPSSPLAYGANSKRSNATAGPSTLRAHHEPATPPPRNAKRPLSGVLDMPPPPAPKSPTTATRQREREKEKSQSMPSTPAATPRKAAGSVTATLAQKLNELALANSEGLLNDDEYRLLRQNLFERFSTTASVPSESPVIPVAKLRQRGNSTVSIEGRSIPRPISGNFQVQLPRSPSVDSRNSVTSGVASIFRLARGRRSTTGLRDTSDASSVMSTTSGKSSIFRLSRSIVRKSSISSVNTTASRAQADNLSITSRRTNVGSDRMHSDSVLSLSPTGPRSASGSVRRFNTPPSSFPVRAMENKQLGNYSGLYDEDHLQTSQDIKQEILTVEAEARSMMDAFNGLELTALAKMQKSKGRSSVIGPDGDKIESTWTLIPEGSQSRMNVDNDSTSVRSGMSAGTSPSIPRSAYSTRHVRPKKSLGSSGGPGMFLHRQNSSSSFGSFRTNFGHLSANNSNLSLTRSNHHLPMMGIVSENGKDKSMMLAGGEEEDEMDDIRQRREEVMLRYEARLEYLRAKLKGAQLHEKLIR
ncbi:hypothetical protein AX17_005268 [Amanita inopinata Kibby_2008]|nr:hypothetical protein AX17_005268 [Amanita inopinata Kibby_2008]